MSEHKFQVGDWVKCIKFDGASGKRLMAWKGRDGVYQVIKTKFDDSDYIYLDGDDYNGSLAVYSSRFVLTGTPPMECDSLEDILAEQELYAKLEGER